MDSTIWAAVIGAIAAVVAAIIGRENWKLRRKLHTLALRNKFNAFMAGWGSGRLVDEWINLEKGKITPNFLSMVSQVQPYFDTLGLGVDLLDSFKKGKFPDGLVPFTFEMKSKLSAQFGNDVGYAFELGQGLVLNTKAIYKYATDESHRTMLENQGIALLLQLMSP